MPKEQRVELPIQMYNIVRKVNDEEAKDISPLEYYKHVEVFYVYGDSGAGKTKWCIMDMKKENLFYPFLLINIHDLEVTVEMKSA